MMERKRVCSEVEMNETLFSRNARDYPVNEKQLVRQTCCHLDHGHTFSNQINNCIALKGRVYNQTTEIQSRG